MNLHQAYEQVAAAVGEANLKFKAYSQYQASAAVDMAKAWGKHKERKIDVSGGVCLGLSLAFLRYRWMKDLSRDGSMAIEPLLEGIDLDFDEQLQVLKNEMPRTRLFEKQNPDPNEKTPPKHTFGARLAAWSPYEAILDIMEQQRDYSARNKGNVGIELYKEIGRKMLPSLIIDHNGMSSRPDWTTDLKVRSGYHAVDAPHHTMAFCVHHGLKSFKYFDPNCGYVGAKDFVTFSRFLSVFLGNAVGADWTIYSWNIAYNG